MRALPPSRIVILSGEKRQKEDNECQNSCDLVIDLGEAATRALKFESRKNIYPLCKSS